MTHLLIWFMRCFAQFYGKILTVWRLWFWTLTSHCLHKLCAVSTRSLSWSQYDTFRTCMKESRDCWIGAVWPMTCVCNFLHVVAAVLLVAIVSLGRFAIVTVTFVGNWKKYKKSLNLRQSIFVQENTYHIISHRYKFIDDERVEVDVNNNVGDSRTVSKCLYQIQRLVYSKCDLMDASIVPICLGILNKMHAWKSKLYLRFILESL